LRLSLLARLRSLKAIRQDENKTYTLLADAKICEHRGPFGAFAQVLAPLFFGMAIALLNLT
jgi:hypothetical protein